MSTWYGGSHSVDAGGNTGWTYETWAWYAGANSVNAGGNAGWIFGASPIGATGWVSGFMREDATGRLALVYGSSGDVWVGGYVRSPSFYLSISHASATQMISGKWRDDNGYLMVAIATGTATDCYWAGGFLRSSTGLLAVDTTSNDYEWVGGFLRTAEGRLACAIA